MSQRLTRLLALKPFLIGMVHLRPLPGTAAFNPRFESFAKVSDIALEEARVLVKHGVDGLLIENMHDVPYLRGESVGPEVVACMATIAGSIRKEFPQQPIGIQILAGANRQAVAVAAAAHLDFVRVEGFVFSHIADEGFIDACAGDLLRYRKAIEATDVAIFADIKKKHSSHAITEDLSHVEVAEAAKFCKADGVIVTGTATGHAPSDSLVNDISSSMDLFPILVGSGIDRNNVKSFAEAGASGFIVGSTFKKEGNWANVLDPSRISAFVARVREIREN